MKRLLCATLAVCLLIPSGAFAAEYEASIPDNILSERNHALTDYLSENLSDEMSGDVAALNAVIEQFSKEYPQYERVLSSEKNVTNSATAPKELETVDLYSSETKVSESETKGTEYYVTYYDNGCYMVGELSYTRNEAVDASNVSGVLSDKVGNMDANASINPQATADGTASANNIHNYYDNNNIFLCRTFLTASFYYDNTNNRKFCQPTGWSGNQRVRNNNFTYLPAGYNYTHPYNDSVARVQRTQRFYERGYHLLDDDLRISCNHLGTIFKN